MSEIADWRQGGFGIYVHWPFCQSKCPYCDFNSHVAAQIDQEAWAAAYVSEIDRLAEQTRGRLVNSIFFGGGTPSLMQVPVVARVIERIAKHWVLANDVEITLEANPGSIEASRFEGYRLSGVNRVSMGMQAMNDADLRAFGRLHTAEEALQAFDVARHCFDRVSFDLIYARQGQSLIQWEAELNRALGLAVDHLSLYQLTIEEGTAFGDRYARGRLRGLPNEDLSADMFELTQDLCAAGGFPAYEVSNHARPGAESLHNRIYWNSGDYLGIGPGAHGRITLNGVRHCTEATRNPGAWMKQLRDTGAGESVRAALSQSEQADEYILMGLRLTEGLDLRRLETISGLAPSHGIVRDLQENGLIDIDSSHIRTTTKGRMVLNHVIKELAASLQPIR